MSVSEPKVVFNKPETYTSWDQDYYPPLAEWFYDEAVRRMLRAMQVQPNQTVLDAGCGPGVHSIRAARFGAQVTAADVSAVALQEAAVRVERAGYNRQVNFQQADLTRLPFTDASFDHVFSWGVIIHIPTVEDALREMVRVVKPGGSLALYVNNLAALDVKGETMGRMMLRRPPLSLEHHPLGASRWYTFHGARLWLWRFDMPALARHVEGLGMQRTYRMAGEFTEFQRRCKGVFRNGLLHLNNLYLRMRLPAWAASANLLVFQKPRG